MVLKQRKIKFRVWDKENKKMIEEGCSLKPTGWSIASIDAWEHEMDEPFVWMQFTGILDRNGTPVYEGDIIRIMYHYDSYGAKEHEELRNYQVTWWKESGSWQMENSGRLFKDVKEGEVIGNIYQNENLLK